MNAERLLELFERIADAPNAIARVRRFILDLAVRGKLVPQDAKDEPASNLFKRVAKKKSQAGKQEKVEPEFDNEKELGELPSTWRGVSLISLGSWAIGTGFPKNEQGSETGPHFFLKVSDMNLPGNEKYVTTSNNFIDDDAARRMRAKIHPPGTIIFPKIGGAIATNKRRILAILSGAIHMRDNSRRYIGSLLKIRASTPWLKSTRRWCAISRAAASPPNNATSS